MKKSVSLFLAAILFLCLLPSCGSSSSSAETKKTVNLMDQYTISDPAGVDYDQRRVFYERIKQDDNRYAIGLRTSFCVLYGKGEKGVYMYNVDVFDAPESAAAYMEVANGVEVDGKVCISKTDKDYFVKVERTYPNFQAWVDNLKESGMTELPLL